MVLAQHIEQVVQVRPDQLLVARGTQVEISANQRQAGGCREPAAHQSDHLQGVRLPASVAGLHDIDRRWDSAQGRKAAIGSVSLATPAM
jgi:hypothetical protein